MRFYFAPLEGITNYLYRNAYHEFFHDFDSYFTPFIVPHEKRALSTRDIEEINPIHNKKIHVVPQILTNHAEDFIRLSKELKEYYYTEVNLNLGCPSGTVVSKGRGAGFLAHKEELQSFLYEIFAAGITDISIKTRLGMENPDEFHQLIEIFNQFKMKELILHPRVRKDYYKNQPNLEAFGEALAARKNPVCYNGNIFSVEDYRKITELFPSVESVMIGRGAIANPGLLGEILGEGKISKPTLKEFHNWLYADCRTTVSGEKYQLFRMKEYWCYLVYMFEEPERHWRELRKTQRICDFDSIIRVMFYECELAEHAGL